MKKPANSELEPDGAEEPAKSRPRNEETGSPRDDATGVLSGARDITFVGTIYLYIAGFTYYYFFLSELGIPISLTDTPVYQFFVYSYEVFTSVSAAPIYSAVLGLLVAAWFFADESTGYFAFRGSAMPQWVPANPIAKRDRRKTIIVYSCVAALLLSVTVFSAYSVATTHVRQLVTRGDVSGGLIHLETKRTHFDPRKGSELPRQFLIANGRNALLLLLESKDQYVVVVVSPRKSFGVTTVDHVKTGTIISIRKDDIASFEVVP